MILLFIDAGDAGAPAALYQLVLCHLRGFNGQKKWQNGQKKNLAWAQGAPQGYRKYNPRTFQDFKTS